MLTKIEIRSRYLQQFSSSFSQGDGTTTSIITSSSGLTTSHATRSFREVGHLRQESTLFRGNASGYNGRSLWAALCTLWCFSPKVQYATTTGARPGSRARYGIPNPVINYRYKIDAWTLACLYLYALSQHDSPVELPALPERPAALVRLRRVAQDQCRPPSGRSWRGGRGCRRRRPEEETVLCGRRRACSSGRGVHGVGRHTARKAFTEAISEAVSEGHFRRRFPRSFLIYGWRLQDIYSSNFLTLRA